MAFMILAPYTGIVAGTFLFYFTAMPLGLALYFLALRPIDARPIRVACRLFFVLCSILPLPALKVAVFDFSEMNILRVGFIAFVLILSLTAAILWPTLNACRRPGAELMPPRRQLRRLWLVIRLGCLATTIILMGLFLAPLLCVLLLLPPNLRSLRIAL